MRCILVLFLLLFPALIAGSRAASDTSQCSRVVSQADIRMTESGGLVVNGTNMTPQQFTNYISRAERPDLYVLYRGDSSGTASNLERFVAQRIARSGVPLLVTQPDGTMTFGPKPEAQTPMRLKLNTDQLKQLRSASGTVTSSLSLGVGGLWSPENESYIMQRIELGLPGRKFWFIYDASGNEDENGAAAVQWKKDW
ncbi:MAG: hypothetical protein KJ626_09435 [Verrucomicrobia bacterium]|nr:hypothetical protein [Verrucomicrobiota bacterium]